MSSPPPFQQFTSSFSLPSHTIPHEPPPPPPPPKIIHQSPSDPPLPIPRFHDPPPSLNLASSSFDPGSLSIPVTPTTPSSPSSSAPPSPSPDGKQKKSNPLTDLIETEKVYVDQLTGIIRKVAAAWSRSKLPPPELDIMFRSVEGVYKANRSLYSKLKDIGTNPKALGDLLMRWIDDLETPYTTYCSKFCTGFDTWEPVQSNSKLHTILASFSASNPPPLMTGLPGSSESSLWTLDSLFLLPKTRLKYYKKLYSRLLKSTAPGRSDHKLLLGALERLDILLATLESRGDITVASDSFSIPPQDEVVINLAGDNVGQNNSRISDVGAGSASSSTRGSSLSSGERLSRETASTSISRGSTHTLSMPISDLERRLATDRTLDIFTMKPKAVRLQMAPPSLPFVREMRFSVDAVVRLTPRATGIEVVHRYGHLFLLSDLFLVCEKMMPEERTQAADGQDLWLCYPPLAGKVLRVSEISGQDDTLQVTVMRKETFIIQVESMQMRNFMLNEFRECVDFASTVLASSKQQPPPVPPLNGLPRSPSSGLSPARSPPILVPMEHDRPPREPPRLPTIPLVSPINEPPMSTLRDESKNLTQRPLEDGYPPSDVPLPEREPNPAPVDLPSQADAPPGQVLHMRRPSQPPLLGQPLSFGVGQVIPTQNMAVGQRPGPEPLSRVPSNPNQMPPHTLQQPTIQPPLGPPPIPHHQPMMNTQFHPQRPPNGLSGLPPRPSADPALQSGIRKSPSGRSLHGDHPANSNYGPGPLNVPYDTLRTPRPRALLPSENSRALSMIDPKLLTEHSPPSSPVQDSIPTGPVTSIVSAQMKCKIFLQQQHAQWKSLGAAKLKLYRQTPTNVKQLVVEAENKEKSVLISTIVLTDGVERVGKTGVAIELSDKGQRTGIVYMIQLRNENSAGGLFDSLLAGSDRAGRS